MRRRFSSLPTTCVKSIAPHLTSRCTVRGIPNASSRWSAGRSVAFEDIGADEWADKVYRRDIVHKPETRYKRPGSKM